MLPLPRRDNLDPFGCHRPRDLERVLKATTLWDMLEQHVLTHAPPPPHTHSPWLLQQQQQQQQILQATSFTSRDPSRDLAKQSSRFSRLWFGARPVVLQQPQLQSPADSSGAATPYPSGFLGSSGRCECATAAAVCLCVSVTAAVPAREGGCEHCLFVGMCL